MGAMYNYCFEMLTSLLIAILLWIAYQWLLKETRRPNRFPPGPPRYPIVGSLPFIMKQRGGQEPTLLSGVTACFEKYGSIVGFWLAKQPAVAVADFEDVKHLLKMEETARRPVSFPLNELRPGWEVLKGTENERYPPGVLFLHGQFWKEQRQFLLRNLKDFGFGKSSVEGLITEEVDKFCQELKKVCGQPYTLAGNLNIGIVNVLWAILIGEKLPFNDPKTIRTVKAFNDLLKYGPGPWPAYATALPSRSMLKWKLLEPLTKRSYQVKGFEEVINLIKPAIDSHMKDFNDEDIRDFVDLVIQKVRTTSDRDSSFHSDRGYEFMVNIIIEMFIGGMETTSSSLLWIFFYMIHHPDVTERVQAEVDMVCLTYVKI